MSKHYRHILLFSGVFILLIQADLSGQLNTFTHDFEEGNLSGWTAKGNAFSSQPTYGDNSKARGAGSCNLHGNWWIGTYENYQHKPHQIPGSIQGDKPTGVLISPRFVIPKGTLSFLIGGGSSFNTRVELVEITGPGEFQSQVIFRAFGKNSEAMERVNWNLDKYAGRTGYINIVDNSSAGWGHINVDDFRFTPAANIIDTPLILKPITVRVPNLYNYKYQDAVKILREYRLSPGSVSEEESSLPKGNVINQNPPAGHSAVINSKVNMVLAKPRTVFVPDLKDKTIEEAGKLLRRYNLKINISGTIESELIPGRIVKQNPLPNKRVEEGSTVSVFTAVPVYVNVPDLYNLNYQEAVRILRENKLSLGIVREEESGMPRGNVIRQEPAARTRVIINTKVNLVIAKQTKVAVPNLIDKTLDEARSLLEESNLNINIAGSRESEIKPGMIAAQNPLPGTLVEVRTTVSVFTAAPIVVTVPNLKGYSIEEARQVLETHSLVLGQINELESDENQNKIINQNPVAETKAVRGDTVSVTVAVKGEEITVPDLTGKTVKQAAGILNKSGLAIGQISESDENKISGIILSQVPAEGVKVKPGSRVNITVQKQKYGLILSTSSAAVDSGETIKFTAAVAPGTGSIKYKFYFGDGGSSNWTSERVFEYSYRSAGNFMPYAEARINGENIIRSEPVNITVSLPGKDNETELLLILSLIGAFIIISGSVYAYKKYIKSEKDGNIINKSFDIRAFKDSGIQKIENEESMDLKYRISIRLIKNAADSQIKISGLQQ